MQQRYKNRTQAGQELAKQLAHYRDTPDVLVLGLPRGGVPVAYEVARALDAPLDVFVVRKLGVPGHEELAMGALASGNVRVLNDDVVQQLSLGEEIISELTSEKQHEVAQREQRYRGERDAVSLAGRPVILVDDGLATGATMRAAAQAARQQQPTRVVIAVPVGAADVCAELGQEADEVVCAMTPPNLGGISAWYVDFRQTSDEEVKHILAQASAER